jgi:2-aminoethylphosphonate-pyruvate transaminase
MIRSAVILAAGLGSRLKEKTEEKPKGFITIDGIPIIEYSIAKLLKVGIQRIIIGTGYKSIFYDGLRNKFPQIVCVKSEDYANTGSMFTLYNLRKEVKEDFLLLESDLIYEKSGLKELMEDVRPNLILGSGRTNSGDEVYIQADEKNRLINMSKDIGKLDSIHSELVGISKLSYQAFRVMCDFAVGEFQRTPKLDYESALVGISRQVDIFVKKNDNFPWCEIDDETHYNRAISVVYPIIRGRELNAKAD